MNTSTNKVSVCKQDVCVNVYSGYAKAVAGALVFAAFAYGASQLIKPKLRIRLLLPQITQIYTDFLHRFKIKSAQSVAILKRILSKAESGLIKD